MGCEELASGVECLYPNNQAFLALKGDGSVVAWGNIYTGGDASKVKEELRSGVVRVFSTPSCFLVVKADQSMVAWGSGAPPDEIKAKLSGLRELCCNGEGTAV